METMELYRRAQDGFEAVLGGVKPDQWGSPSACSEWSVRDVAGHLIWGQRQMRAWATGEDYSEPGSPGSPHPGVLAGEDPFTTWQEARAESVATLTEDALVRPVSIPGMGDVPLAGMVTLLITDHVAHTWDIGHALGMPAKLDPVLVTTAFDWSQAHVMRRPGFFGPELTPPDGADEQTRMLAFLGRAPWQQVTS